MSDRGDEEGVFADDGPDAAGRAAAGEAHAKLAEVAGSLAKLNALMSDPEKSAALRREGRFDEVAAQVHGLQAEMGRLEELAVVRLQAAQRRQGQPRQFQLDAPLSLRRSAHSTIDRMSGSLRTWRSRTVRRRSWK